MPLLFGSQKARLRCRGLFPLPVSRAKTCVPSGCRGSSALRRLPLLFLHFCHRRPRMVFRVFGVAAAQSAAVARPPQGSCSRYERKCKLFDAIDPCSEISDTRKLLSHSLSLSRRQLPQGEPKPAPPSAPFLLVFADSLPPLRRGPRHPAHCGVCQRSISGDSERCREKSERVAP